MTYSEAKKALARSSWADCITANLNAHPHSRGVSWTRGGRWKLARAADVERCDSASQWTRRHDLGAIEYASESTSQRAPA